ncbi:hypothetical protein HNP86_001837 [Methanococcus maripaludis]|uniref:Uncharacterized protein n=1 Tax=Methanococcus maripaludis TaxID=39152 RepID=A0A7J9NVH5_METMI|nr:hypothetical protein [Methanococcus maripaludis]MBA2851678.1 hypothetical protein [Methanococcus maripaludis]
MLPHEWSNEATAMMDLFIGDGMYGIFGKYVNILYNVDKNVDNNADVSTVAYYAETYVKQYIEDNKHVISPFILSRLEAILPNVIWEEIAAAILENTQTIYDEFDRWGELYMTAILKENVTLLENKNIRTALQKHGYLIESELFVDNLE